MKINSLFTLIIVFVSFPWHQSVASKGYPTIEIAGRVMIDAAAFHDDKAQLKDNVKIRRARLQAKGVIAPRLKYSAGVEYALDSYSLKSVYLKYLASDCVSFYLGQFKEPFSLEELTSSNDTTFMERALPNTFAPARKFGGSIHVSNNLFSQSYYTFDIGIFGEEQGFESSSNATEGVAITSRLTIAQVNDKDDVILLGVSGSHRKTDGNDKLRIRERPETRITDTRLVDTRTMEEVRFSNKLGLEAASVFGPLSVQAEYLYTKVHRYKHYPSLAFNGGYVFLSWLVTGESRPYLISDANFGRIKPKNRYGAIELALRYSSIDLDDKDITGGKEHNYTFGLNWYIRPCVRVMLNLTKVYSEKEQVKDRPSFVGIRGQFDF